MAIEYRYSPGERLVFATFTGEVTDQQLTDHAKAMLADPALGGGPVGELADLSQADLSGVSQGGLRNMAAVLRDRSCLDRLALYAPHDLPYGLARMFAVLTSDAAVAVEPFRSADDARAWLGMAPAGGAA